MELTLQNFTPAEQATFRLRALYEQGGYRKYRASRFEEYALYQEYQRFLPDPQVITFTDLDGKLRAIKPDVTLSIAKTAQPAPGECKRFYYNEEVCRASRESHTFQTIHQMGLECMGEVDEAAQAEVLRLALASLAALDVPTVLEVSHMGFVTGLLDVLDVPATAHARLVELLCAKNEHELRKAALQAGADEAGADALCGLLTLHGPFGATLTAAKAAAISPSQKAALAELLALQNALGEAGRGLQLDLSMADEAEYYNGIVFTGYAAGIPRAVLKGGQYDYLMQRFTPGAKAIGFAMYLDELERLAAPLPPVQQQGGEKTWLRGGRAATRAAPTDTDDRTGPGVGAGLVPARPAPACGRRGDASAGPCGVRVGADAYIRPCAASPAPVRRPSRKAWAAAKARIASISVHRSGVHSFLTRS